MVDVAHSEFFREVTLRISGSLDIDVALTKTLEYFQRHMPVDAMDLHYLDFDRNHIIPVARVARDGYEQLWEDAEQTVRMNNEFLQIVKDREDSQKNVEIFNTPDTMPQAALALFPKLANYSILTLPLCIKGENVGGLVLLANGHNRYTGKDAELLQVVARPIAMAMNNARRYLDLRYMRDLLEEDTQALKADIERNSGTEIVGADFGLRQVMDLVRRIAPSDSPTLLLGETGTGKEVIANAIHLASPRRDGPMIKMQCGGVPESLLDSELFGHEKGAFTGAVTRKRGRFERAQKGTLFLDEIGELTADAQVKLLRVLQEKQFERVGGMKTLVADVRIIAATHRDLETMVREGAFREDLWYRLNVLPITIPPLRMRSEDIPSLVQYFAQRKATELHWRKTPHISPEQMEMLKSYKWPGNVRELQNIIERAIILAKDANLIFPEISPLETNLDPSIEKEPIAILPLDTVVARQIRQALKHANGQVSGCGGAAELLQIHPSTLRFRIKKLGLEDECRKRSFVQ